jgi:hypothetical protein
MASQIVRRLADDVACVCLFALAVPAGMCPRRWWQRLDWLPIESYAWLSSLTTLVTGLTFGAIGYLAFADDISRKLTDLTFKVAERQLTGQLPGTSEISTTTPSVLSALSLVTFVLLTPAGLVATYLVLSGLVRVVGAFLVEPFGDPVLTGLDGLATRLASRTRRRLKRYSRERREGREVPDELFPAAWARVPDADYVVVSSRPKPEWTMGTFVIAGDRWFSLGVSFEVTLPAGLRTVYPLSEQTVMEVLRRAVTYELPPLQAVGPRILSD